MPYPPVDEKTTSLLKGLTGDIRRAALKGLRPQVARDVEAVERDPSHLKKIVAKDAKVVLEELSDTARAAALAVDSRKSLRPRGAAEQTSEGASNVLARLEEALTSSDVKRSLETILAEVAPAEVASVDEWASHQDEAVWRTYVEIALNSGRWGSSYKTLLMGAAQRQDVSALTKIFAGVRQPYIAQSTFDWIVTSNGSLQPFHYQVAVSQKFNLPVNVPVDPELYETLKNSRRDTDRAAYVNLWLDDAKEVFGTLSPETQSDVLATSTDVVKFDTLAAGFGFVEGGSDLVPALRNIEGLSSESRAVALLYANTYEIQAFLTNEYRENPARPGEGALVARSLLNAQKRYVATESVVEDFTDRLGCEEADTFASVFLLEAPGCTSKILEGGHPSVREKVVETCGTIPQRWEMLATLSCGWSGNVTDLLEAITLIK